MKGISLLLLLSLSVVTSTLADDAKLAAEAVNTLGLDLYRARANSDDNLVFSPYSIQNALAMTYAGAAGRTRAEMQAALHYPKDDQALHASFGALGSELRDTAAKSLEAVKNATQWGGPRTPIEFHLANRLFAQRGDLFRAPFVDTLDLWYGAPLAEVDYATEPEKARAGINQWIADQTKDRIRDLLPSGSIAKDTRLVLVNALYLNAPWEKPFTEKATKLAPFHVHGREMADVPMMMGRGRCGHALHDGFQIVTRPYAGGDLQFVIFLPDKPDGLAALEDKLTPGLLAECARMPAGNLVLYLPKIHLEPATIDLAKTLKALGMKTAFDDPPGSADFDGISPRKSGGKNGLGAVFHKTWLTLNEKGTEAAAATAVKMVFSDRVPEVMTTVRVDHPFLFAIQHVPSGTCLFLGRVTDPR